MQTAKFLCKICMGIFTIVQVPTPLLQVMIERKLWVDLLKLVVCVVLTTSVCAVHYTKIWLKCHL